MGGLVVGARARSLQGKAASVAAVLGVVAASAGVMVGTAGAANAAKPGAVAVCHATGSATNPYVIQTPANMQGVNRHLDNHEGDFLLPASGVCIPPTGQAPDESTPDESTPDESTPDETKPDETTPDETTPDETTPDETTPDETDQDNTDQDDTDQDDTDQDDTDQDDTDQDGVKPGEGKSGNGGERPGANTPSVRPATGSPVVLGAEKTATSKGLKSARVTRTAAANPNAAVPTAVAAGLGSATAHGNQLDDLGGRLVGGGLLLLLGAAALALGNRRVSEASSDSTL